MSERSETEPTCRRYESRPTLWRFGKDAYLTVHPSQAGELTLSLGSRMNGALTITELLRSASDGDDESLRIVFERLYRDLRQIAVARLRSSASRTLTPTALVHEVFERLMGSQQLDLNDRGHFFACAARAMRMVVVDYARRGSAKKRNRDPVTISISEGEASVVDVLDLDRALSELEAVNPRACELVGLRYFVGLTMDEISEMMGISLRTTNREWQKARAFLFARMSGDDNP